MSWMLALAGDATNLPLTLTLTYSPAALDIEPYRRKYLWLTWQPLLCLQDQAQCRDSHSTISGRGGGVGPYDYLGRPVLHNNSRRGRDRLMDRDEESRLRVESYVRNSNMSLVSIYRGKLRPDFSNSGMNLTVGIITCATTEFWWIYWKCDDLISYDSLKFVWCWSASWQLAPKNSGEKMDKTVLNRTFHDTTLNKVKKKPSTINFAVAKPKFKANHKGTLSLWIEVCHICHPNVHQNEL